MIEEIKPIWDRIGAKLPPPIELTPEEEARQAREAESRAWLDAAPKIGVPRRSFDASLEGGLASLALDRVRDYIKNDEVRNGRCLVLTGPTGVGKTYATVAALRAQPHSRRRFFYFPGLCGALLDPERRTEALETAKRVHFVVLDDFGTEYVKEGGLLQAFVDEIVWHREGAILPTITTTNLTADQLKERLSDRIVDRLRGDWGHVFAATGPSLRVR